MSQGMFKAAKQEMEKKKKQMDKMFDFNQHGTEPPAAEVKEGFSPAGNNNNK